MHSDAAQMKHFFHLDTSNLVNHIETVTRNILVPTLDASMSCIPVTRVLVFRGSLVCSFVSTVSL